MRRHLIRRLRVPTPLSALALPLGSCPLSSGFVDGVLEAVLVELGVGEVSAPITVGPEDDLAGQRGMIIFDLGQQPLDGHPTPRP